MKENYSNTKIKKKRRIFPIEKFFTAPRLASDILKQTFKKDYIRYLDTNNSSLNNFSEQNITTYKEEKKITLGEKIDKSF